ncbi:T9SS type A sorting domain-containing protein [Hymenobacter cavernae]|uniref:T9SS C-terminal target domain-containing protein n=1 Tax=Hymenobacter cavernae TaxID=2044852 RepID=A0ABQ1UWH7_9BACT|nr:T9SS type A sorting domain-containing protein [Hymenobacter cavernae]GGF28315.1 hypothetical protein GCM10011383_45080 [Hymenobacter cavernae]
MKHAYFGVIIWFGTLTASAQGLTNSGATITLGSGASVQVEGAFLNTSSGTLMAPDGSLLQLTGNLTNQGTLTLPGKLVFNGQADQTLRGGGSFGTIEVNNTGAPGANRLLVPDDISISTQLLLTQGLLRTDPAAIVSLLGSAEVVGEAAGKYVQGNLRIRRAAVNAGTGAVSFSHGVVLNPNGQDLGAVTITRTAGLQLAGVSYGTNLGSTRQGLDRVWQVVAEQPPAAPVTLTLSWVADDDHGVSSTAPVQLWRAETAAAPWNSVGAPASASGRSFTASVAQLGTFTLSSASQPLPVELLHFSVQRQGTDALVRWATASEQDNAYFELESSIDGQAFQSLGRVAGQGSSSQAHAYQWVDQNLARYAAEHIYYRLHQVDHDGTETYSPVQVLQMSLAEGLQVQAWPNPYQQQFSLTVQTQLAGPAQVQITDAVGRLLSERQVQLPVGTSTLPLEEAARLTPGVYLLRVQQAEQQRMLKLVRE